VLLLLPLMMQTEGKRATRLVCRLPCTDQNQCTSPRADLPPLLLAAAVTAAATHCS
jgi:hypothetical protein